MNEATERLICDGAKGGRFASNRLGLVLCASFLGVNIPLVLFAQQAVADKDIPAFMALHWERTLNVHLPDSNAIITELPGDVIVTGDMSMKAGQLLGLGEFVKSEALAFDPTKQTSIIYFYNRIGFVSTRFWESFDADRLLQKTKAVTEAGNMSRRSSGQPEIYLVGWFQRPVVNFQSHSVSWSFRVSIGDETILNAIAIKLGRFGTERITSTGQVSDAVAVTQRLAQATDAFRFNVGQRYDDFVPGHDKTADNGTFDGVGNSVLGKSIAATFVGLLAPLLAGVSKAAIGLILVPIYALWRLGRSISGRPERATNASETNVQD